MTKSHAVFFALVVASCAAGCHNKGARNDPFLQRRIIAPAPPASYAPPNVQVPSAVGVPPLQPVPGPQGGPLGSAGQWSPAASTQSPGNIRPASATSETTNAVSDPTGDGWVPADKPAATPPDHSAAHPVDAPQSAQVASIAPNGAAASLDWATPRRP